MNRETDDEFEQTLNDGLDAARAAFWWAIVFPCAVAGLVWWVLA